MPESTARDPEPDGVTGGQPPAPKPDSVTDGPSPDPEPSDAAGADRVVVLDEAAAPIGVMDKLAAHRRPPTPHLAFSIVLFGADGSTLLQRRAAGKYHFAGRWSNACCSHPRPGEPVTAAARRRLREELGVVCDDLAVHGAFWYAADDPGSDLSEREYDVVLVGTVTGLPPAPSPVEVDATALRDPDDVLAACAADPAAYTPWLPRALRIALGPPTPVVPGVPL